MFVVVAEVVAVVVLLEGLWQEVAVERIVELFEVEVVNVDVDVHVGVYKKVLIVQDYKDLLRHAPME